MQPHVQLVPSVPTRMIMVESWLAPSPFNHDPARVGPMRFAMSTNSSATLRTVLAASALVERVSATHVRAQVIGNSLAGRQTRQRMWDAFCKELWEIAWLTSLVGGLSIAGLALAVILVQP